MVNETGRVLSVKIYGRCVVDYGLGAPIQFVEDVQVFVAPSFGVAQAIEKVRTEGFGARHRLVIRTPPQGGDDGIACR